MTVIAYRDGVLAADTGAFFGDVCASFTQRKVVRTKFGELAAACGEVPQIEQFHSWLNAGANLDDKPFKDVEEQGFGAIIVRPSGKLELIDHQLRFYEPGADFAVEGCHQEFMLALMLAGYSAIDTVAMAIKHCSHASGEVYSLKLGDTDGD